MQTVLVMVAASALLGGACNRARSEELGGPVSQSAADRYLRKAIRSSAEGVILLPSARAATFFEADLLNAVAQDLRSPAAACFVNRAIETMTRVRRNGGWIYENIPEGQFKVRVRLAPDGLVLRADVLESGFVDPGIEPCLLDVIQGAEWPANQSGVPHYVDVVYWVSLGSQAGLGSEEAALAVRKEQAAAARRAKPCLERKPKAGSYRIESLSLLDREGHTLVNRVEPSSLDEKAAACVAAAFKEIRLPRDPQSFVRPLSPVLEFKVEEDGTITLADDEWYTLLQHEERARRAARRAELGQAAEVTNPAPEPASSRIETPALGVLGNQVTTPPKAPPSAEPGPLELPQEAASDAVPGPSPSPEESPEESREDPAKAGLKLDLSGPRGL